MDGSFDISWAWGLGLIGFAFGTVCGLAIAYLTFTRTTRGQVKTLEASLESERQKNSEYREQVNQHFRKTSDLVQRMTDSYRDVYEHLASGSAALCQDPVSTPQLDIPKQPVLDTSPDNPPEPADNQEFADAEIDPLQEDDDDTCMGDAPCVPRLETETPVSHRTPSM